MESYLLEMKEISKSFGAVKALKKGFFESKERRSTGFNGRERSRKVYFDECT